MSFENDLHDWYIDSIELRQSEITLLVHLYEARRRITFKGVTRCLLDNLLMTNIIYAAKIISIEDEPESYTRLEASYPAKWSGTAPKILSINGAVGLDGIIEFSDLEVVDV
ncbi:MAG TPA: hypothetical protein VM782_23350 [Stellaceae bacterium]|nr:hypothetical protein [Stellaceae bacterium]